jgi:hypothetical protein
MLPDNVLLEIFDFRRKSHNGLADANRPVWRWHLLVHVCQRWRQIVFASPHRLNLQILCTHGTPLRNLGVWPAFPIVMNYYYYSKGGITLSDEDNVVAALEHLDRVCDVRLAVMGSQLGKMATVMQEPFPVLKSLHIFSRDGNAPALPTEFLGGSAPCLLEIHLHGIPYPALPTLLLSASDLVTLELRRIPPTGYISPKAMVACLAALPRLDTFVIGFQLATSRPNQIHPPPVTRTILPALNCFQFRGASEYLEELVAQVDSPQLNRLSIDYLNQLVDFQVPQLSEFVSRSEGLNLTLFEHANVTFYKYKVSFDGHPRATHHSWDWGPARTVISCKGIDWQVSHMAQVLSQLSAILPNVVHLRLEAEPYVLQLEGTDDVDWQHLLRQFSTVQTLHVTRVLAGHVALALEDITGEMVAEVLPSLDLISLEDQPASSIKKFVAVRQLSGRPVTFAGTTGSWDFDRRLESYVSK